MGWTVKLENKNGEMISGLNDELNIAVNLLYSNDKSFKLLKYIDPYGDTIFNKLQMSDLITDLERLKKYEMNNSLIEEIINMAQLCKSEIHTYLVFYGD